MGILGYIGKKEADARIKDAVSAMKKKQSIIQSINAESLDRAKADVAKWRTALEEWEGIGTNLPDRYEMMQIYAEIIQDDAVSTHLTTIKRSIEGTEFQVGVEDKDGKITIDQEKTALFASEWFEEIIKAVIEAEMMGFTLVEVSPATNDGYTPDHIKVVPRHMVVPEWKKVRTRPQVWIDMIDYTDPMYYPRLVEIGDRYEKGLFNSLALIYIYKKNAMAYWSNFQAKFGVPPVIVRTDLTNTVKVTSLTTFLQSMRSNSFSIVGYDDEVSVLDAVNSDAYQTFEKLIQHCNAQIAKVLEGQTMTSADGSSRSQAEVHERIAEEFHQARLRRVERIVNTKLMPIIRQDFPGYENMVFKFSEKKNVDSVIDRAVKLKQAGYKVDKDFLIEVTGMPIEEIEEAPAVQPQSVVNAIDALYSNALGDAAK